jgi:hypothetical protein
VSNSNQISGRRPTGQQQAVSARQLRVGRPRFFLGLFVVVCGFQLLACRSSQESPNSDVGSTNTRKTALTTPPFSTKEPDRYQAKRITTFINTESAGNPSSSLINEVLIARDGEKRREEFSAGVNGRIVYFELPAGRYLVLPATKVYADLNTTDPAQETDESVELSADQLVNESHAPATYEKLGSESIEGRSTIKYRVATVSKVESQSETLIWIDETLGIPIRSETMSTSSGRSSKVTVELKDIRLDLAEGLFSWPADYKKVEPRLILDLIRK